MSRAFQSGRLLFRVACFFLLSIPSSVAAQSLGLAPAEVRANFKPGQLVQFDLEQRWRRW